jgi:hypothetical protein
MVYTLHNFSPECLSLYKISTELGRRERIQNERRLRCPSVKLILHLNFLFFNFCAQKLKMEGKKLDAVLN